MVNKYTKNGNFLKVGIPRGYMNCEVCDNYLYMDTNDSVNCDKLKLKLPKANSKWVLHSYENLHSKKQKIVLIDKFI